MSNIQTVPGPTQTQTECILAASGSYIETLTIKTIETQPGLIELVIKTQLLSARKPEEKRVKSRTCVDRARLAEMQDAIGQFLQPSRQSDEAG